MHYPFYLVSLQICSPHIYRFHQSSFFLYFCKKQSLLSSILDIREAVEEENEGREEKVNHRKLNEEILYLTTRTTHLIFYPFSFFDYLSYTSNLMNSTNGPSLPTTFVKPSATNFLPSIHSSLSTSPTAITSFMAAKSILNHLSLSLLDCC